MLGLRILRSRWAVGAASFLFIDTIVFAASVFAAAPSGVTNIFKPLSTPAQAVYELSLLVLVICAGIFFLVGGLLIYTIVRFRRRPGDEAREPP